MAFHDLAVAERNDGNLPAWQVRANRYAPLGIALSLGLLLLTTAGLVVLNDRCSASVEQAQSSKAVLADARLKVSFARDGERLYRQAPSTEARAQFNASAAAAIAALNHVLKGASYSQRTTPDDPALLALAYVEAVNKIFVVIDAGNKAAVEAVQAAAVTPAYAALDTALLTFAGRLHTDTIEGIRTLQQVRMLTVVGMPAIFAICAAVLAFFWCVQRACAKTMQIGYARQASAAFHNERRFRGIVQAAPDLILVCDEVANILYANPAAAKFLNVGDPALIGPALLSRLDPAEQVSTREFLNQLCSTTQPGAGRVRRIDVHLQGDDGRWRPVEMTATNMLLVPSVEGLMITLRDSADRKDFERQLTQHVLYDPVTQLPNRVLTNDRLEQAMLRARRADGMVGVLVIEVAGFGEEDRAPLLGEDLAIEAAWRLRSCLRVQDTVARIREDLFVILLEGLGSESDADLVAERVAEQFGIAFDCAGRPGQLTWNAGTAVGGFADSRAEGLLTRAELALARARALGSGRWVRFDARMHAGALDRLELEADLRAADLSTELRLHFQPIVDIASGSIRGVEAFVRWLHPVHGLVAPGEFLAIAADIGLIQPLGRWVIESTCRQVAAWQQKLRFDPPLVAWVNLSQAEFQGSSLVADVTAALQASGLPAACLMLEVSEGVMMRDVGNSVARMWGLKAVGVQFAMDGFGANCSSLSYLRQLPLDVLKVDGSIVRGIDRDPEDAAKVQASIGLGRLMGMRVSGAGIETAEQARLLQSWQCDLGQGYHFGRPAECDVIESVLFRAAAGSQTDGQASRSVRQRPIESNRVAVR